VESVQKYAKKEKSPPMLTLDKKQSANYFLLELLAEQTLLH
jgi:hypothetical protein